MCFVRPGLFLGVLCVFLLARLRHRGESESYGAVNVDTTGEVVGNCQVRQDQVSQAAVSVSERRVSETGTTSEASSDIIVKTSVTGEAVEQMERKISLLLLPWSARHHIKHRANLILPIKNYTG